VRLGLQAIQTVIDLSGDGQLGYLNRVLVHATGAVRIHVSETLVPNDAKGLTPSEIFIREFEDGGGGSTADKHMDYR
jgi:hypothetical protein